MNLPKIKKREKILLISLAGLLFFGFYLKKVYLPSVKKTQGLELQLQQLEAQAKEIKIQFPDVEVDKKQYQASQEQIKQLKNNLYFLERDLFDPNQLFKAIEEIIQSRPDDYNIEFISLRPIEPEEIKQVYDSFDYEIVFKAEFLDIVKYLRRLKDLYPALRVNYVQMSTPSEGDFLYTHVVLGISIILGKPQLIEKINFSRGVDFSKTVQPFVSESKLNMLKNSLTESMKLEGIIFNKDKSIAVINNTTLKVNDLINGKKVLRIMADRVLLEQSGTLYELELQD
ncbi:MAG: hypothetical protein P9L96_00995 [Candidatus Gygaella obscura]|nr:hypothetical protein [Candidatus Gygaella obscura]